MNETRRPEIRPNPAQPRPNPLLHAEKTAFVDMKQPEFGGAVLRPVDRPGRRRDFRILFRKQQAAEAVAGFGKHLEILAYTRGQFSLVDIIDQALAVTGPAALDLCTWNCEPGDVQELAEFQEAGRTLSTRFLLDISFLRRRASLAAQIKALFGLGALRLSRCHAKFFLLTNPDWSVVCQTSQNLNFNPRWEMFTLADDPEFHAFTLAIFDRVFALSAPTDERTKTNNWFWHQLAKAQT